MPSSARSRSIKTQRYQARKYLARCWRFYKASFRHMTLPELAFARRWANIAFAEVVVGC